MKCEAKADILDKTIAFGLLGQVVEVKVNDINGTERLKDLTKVILAKRERQRSDIDSVPRYGSIASRIGARGTVVIRVSFGDRPGSGTRPT